MNYNNEKDALILSGGAAYASYEVGVIKALLGGVSPANGFVPLFPDICTGTSAGAINATVLVSAGASQGIQALEETWFRISSGPGRCGNGIFRVRGNFSRLFDVNCYRNVGASPLAEISRDAVFLFSDFLQRGVEFATSSDPIVQRGIELLDFASFVSTANLDRLLRSTIRPERIRNSSTALNVIATNWQTGEARVFENRDFTDSMGISPVLGSVAIPGLFPFHYIDGVPFADGTVVENTPLMPAIRAGASTIYIVEPPRTSDFPPDSLPSGAETFYRTILIMLNVLIQRDIKTATDRNEGLEKLEQLRAGVQLDPLDEANVSKQVVRNLTRGTQNPYRELTIHRFVPKHQFGGIVGLLDFGEPNIKRLIDQGYRDAMTSKVH